VVTTTWHVLLAVGAAVALAVTAAARRYPDRGALWWLAAALAIPFIADRFLPSGDQDISAVALIFRLILAVVLPLGLLAIEARLSERRKTFAFAITAVILIVIAAVWSTKDLVSLAFVLLGGSVLLGGAILLTRFVTARRPAPAGGGGT
jgi:fumarate reductase subunit D